MSVQTYILDTSVLLHNPRAIYMFEHHKVIIPLSVITKLDKFKQGNQEVNRTARAVILEIDQLREHGRLATGVSLPQGGILQVLAEDILLGETLYKNSVENILQLANYLQGQGEEVIVITKNLSTRIAADALSIRADDLLKDKVDLLYKGWRECLLDETIFKNCVSKKVNPPASGFGNANEFLILKDQADPYKHVIGKMDGQTSQWKPLRQGLESVFGISGRNVQQMMAIELLMNPQINLVSLVGAAGTGKTLLALACGLKQIIDSQSYLKMLVTRPIVPVGKDIGFLPGTKEKKLAHWMQPIFDNLDVVMTQNDAKTREKISYFLDADMFEMEALTYMRGRSIPRQFMIIDEAQNLTPHEIKTIISRAGQKTKIVLTGDPYQIDNPYLDATTNGLAYVVERLKDQAAVGHVTLERSERSDLASLAVEYL